MERDGALAGQEVQTDVLRMEVKALEVELRRARQELGACEAGRREVWLGGKCSVFVIEINSVPRDVKANLSYCGTLSFALSVRFRRLLSSPKPTAVCKC